MSYLSSRTVKTPANDDLLYMMDNGGSSNGNNELQNVTELPMTSSTVVNLNSSMTASEIQDEIDAVERLIPQGTNLTFQFADGTYTLNATLRFSDFYGGGQIFIQGNTGETAGLHTNQAVHLVFNNSTDGIHYTNCPGISLVYIQYLKITVDDNYKAIRQQRESYARIWYNYLVGSGTSSNSRGIHTSDGSHSWIRGNYFTSFRYAIITNFAASVDSHGNDDTGTQPQYGLTATRASTIGKNGTQPAGSVANENTSSGGEIRS